MKRRTIGVFTGSRAEYGLQYPVLQAINAHPTLNYQLFVAGSHYDTDFGSTVDEIETDGWVIHAKEEFTLSDDRLAATSQAIGKGVLICTQVLNQLQPDIFVVYGDRFEAFAALIASTQMGIPTAHIEGGDITQGGCLDDSVRHAMSKLAHLHYVTNSLSADHLLRMGEEAWRISDVGFPGNDLIKAKHYATPEQLVERYGFDLERPIILFTHHPLPTQNNDPIQQLLPSLSALAELDKQGFQIIMTYPNSDASSRQIIEYLHEFVERHPQIQLHTHAGAYDYRGILALIGEITGGVCMGNSSSGIKETPSLACPAINLGLRQHGRLFADNVLNVDFDTPAILAAVEQVMSPEFKQRCKQAKNPYGTGESGQKIAQSLATCNLGPAILLKKTTYLADDS